MPEATQRQAATRPGAGQNAQREPWYSQAFRIAQQAFLIWAVMNLVSGFLTNRPENSSEPVNPANASLQPPLQVAPAWQLGQTFSMHVHFSSSDTPNFARKNEDLPSVTWDNITIGNWKEMREATLEIQTPQSTINNGSLWADIFLVKDGASLDAQEPNSVHHTRMLLTPYMAKPRVRKEKHLLSGANGTVIEEEEPEVIVPHWHGNLTLALISEASSLPYSQLPPVLTEHIHVVPGLRDQTGTKGVYMPIIYPNEFWNLRSQYYPVNLTTAVLPLRLRFQPMSWMKFQIFASLTHGFNEAARKQGGATNAELDEVKRMLVETNPWFLGVTALVSVLHVVFEMLAFSSDVSHWRQKRELVGVSVRTIITNVFVQVVVLLYLIDNNAETSWMVLFGSGVGVLIEAWKITKTVKISLVRAPHGSVIPYTLDIKDKHVLSADEKKTQEYDKLAFRYVSYFAVPTLAFYSIYSLIYETHRGWYSYVITTLTSFVYMFGFAQLVPQLIINYKLKSVAHMPMKAMIYKTLSTVVDDFFAFCIKMPFLHRLACFRDDVVFLVFLYQRWIYRIDPKRVNEYGQVLVEDVVKAEGEGSESKKDR